MQNRFLGRGETIYDRLARRREQDGPLSSEALGELAAETGLPAAFVRSVARFYDDLRESPRAERTLRVCQGEACVAAGAKRQRSRLEDGLADLPAEQVRVGEIVCLGYCGKGPNALLETSGDDAGEGARRTQIFSLAGSGAAKALEALLTGAPIDLPEPVNAIYPAGDERSNVLLRHYPRDVRGLEAAREAGIYGALEAALGRPPEAVIAAIDAAQIRGRGGAGFPAGRKLETVRTAPSRDGRRYVVINADEGDAGAYIDKELLERDPHSVIEGALLAAYAVGAKEGYLYLRGEYPRAHRIVGEALEEARAAGLLGEGILGHDFSFEIELVRGHGAYICGEETSLLRSLEGVPAQVSPKPPYPAIEGLRGAPTVVNNVETLATFPWIVARGGEAYAALGHARSRGTKLLSLNGALSRPGLYEVELGISLRSLLFELAGGMAGDEPFKAVQVGGPLGGIFSEAQLDLPLDFEAFAAAGGMLGHAGIVVYTQEDDLVRVGRELMRFCAIESCGKCFPCRIGSVRGVELFDKILEGRGEQADLELLAELDETLRYGSLCALGGGIPIPIDNLLTTFIDEFRRYVPDARVPERVHRQLEP
ncbi:MAG: NAD(P)H-dependent oxidoreductase subunit E [Myxococcales bacterium]|nr:NAD(P)H-dependent oxidoreductase subunit E [Myxococcales bacterium]